MTRAYLDHNATTTLRPEAAQAVLRALEMTGNPASVHGEGRAARKLIENARVDVARLVNAAPANVTFTSGGTEANHLALHAALAHGVRRILMSSIEHEAMRAPAEACGLPVTLLPADKDGVVEREYLARELTAGEGKPLVILMLANNETGVIQPVAQAARLTHEAGGLIITDAVQAAGKIPVDIVSSGVDMLTLAGHKIGAPMGVGALVHRKGLAIAALQIGGGQEQRRRAGSENVSAIAGMAAAARVARENLADMSRLRELRDAFEARMAAAFPDMVFFGNKAERLPNTSYFAMPGLEAERLLMALDLDGVAVSAGAACSSGKIGKPRVLAAMGVDDALARNAIRLSLGWTSCQEDIDAFVAAWTRLHARTVARDPLRETTDAGAAPRLAEAGR
ncbi:MAG: cysteine desulfurase family protein [Parvibaculum sp.]